MKIKRHTQSNHSRIEHNTAINSSHNISGLFHSMCMRMCVCVCVCVRSYDEHMTNGRQIKIIGLSVCESLGFIIGTSQIYLL